MLASLQSGKHGEVTSPLYLGLKFHLSGRLKLVNLDFDIRCKNQVEHVIISLSNQLTRSLVDRKIFKLYYFLYLTNWRLSRHGFVHCQLVQKRWGR